VDGLYSVDPNGTEAKKAKFIREATATELAKTRKRSRSIKCWSR
jgi:hypothetical protein